MSIIPNLKKLKENPYCEDLVERTRERGMVIRKEKELTLLIQPSLGVDWTRIPEKLALVNEDMELNHRNCVILYREMLRVL